MWPLDILWYNQLIALNQRFQEGFHYTAESCMTVLCFYWMPTFFQSVNVLNTAVINYIIYTQLLPAVWSALSFAWQVIFSFFLPFLLRRHASNHQSLYILCIGNPLPCRLSQDVFFGCFFTPSLSPSLPRFPISMGSPGLWSNHLSFY